MISPNSLQISKNWWIQFPYHLRLITKIRFFAAFGAGGVIYLTSLIFNNLGLSATDIGLGFTISAIIGTLTRLFTGNYLNKTGKIQFPIMFSSASFHFDSSPLFVKASASFGLCLQSWLQLALA